MIEYIAKASGSVVGFKLSNNLLENSSELAEHVTNAGFRLNWIEFHYPSVTSMPPCEATIKMLESRNGINRSVNVTLFPNSFLVSSNQDIVCYTNVEDLIGNGLAEVDGEILQAEDVAFIDLRKHTINSAKEMFSLIHDWCGEEGINFEAFNLHPNDNYSITIEGENSIEFDRNDILVFDCEKGSTGGRIFNYQEDSLVDYGYIISK